MLPLLLLVWAVLPVIVYSSVIRRANAPVCVGLTAKSNNGGRKIAIVIDSSGSMATTDPFHLRLTAANQAIDWLIEKQEASGSQKQDLVTVIDFDSKATLDYPLGDPNAEAKNAVNRIDAGGDTFIAGGVAMAIGELTKAGSGATSGRTGILVFTDGQDTDTATLVQQIDRAAALGIRVAFGFLTSSSTVQETEVLSSIMHSGGRYFTIPSYNASKAFIDGIIVNGLTNQDNPDGDTTTLLSGLEASHFISGSETQTMTYTARDKERLSFSIQSINAGVLNAEVVFKGKTLATAKSSYYGNALSVVSPGDGKMDVKVTADKAPKEAIFVVGVKSNLPPQNCTVGVGSGDKPNIAKIAAPTVICGLGLLGVAGYFLFKYFHPHTPNGHAPPGPTGTEKTPDVTTHPATPGDGGSKSFFKFPKLFPPPSPPGAGKVPFWRFPTHAPPKQPPQNDRQPEEHHDKPSDQTDHDDDDTCSNYTDIEEPDDNGTSPNDSSSNNPSDPHNKHRTHIHRLRTYGNNHHHHIAPQHPCYTVSPKCALASQSHHCPVPTTHKCTCVDPKCKLNSRLHRCEDQRFRHTCLGPDLDPTCPLNDPEYAREKKAERDGMVRKYVAMDLAKKGVTMTAMHLLKAGGVV